MSSPVNRLPLAPRPPFPVWRGEPVPVLLREISQLADIEHRRVPRQAELVGKARRVPNLRRAFANHVHPAPRPAALRGPGADKAGHSTLPVVVLLRRPDFELLSPSVVIRRRPVRVDPLASPVRRLPDLELDSP